MHSLRISYSLENMNSWVVGFSLKTLISGSWLRFDRDLLKLAVNNSSKL